MDTPRPAMIHFAPQTVRAAIAALDQQFNLLEELALSPLRVIIGQVTGGVWKGDGANKFVQEVAIMMIPGVGQLGRHVQTVRQGLQKADEVMQLVDGQIETQVNSLNDRLGRTR